MEYDTPLRRRTAKVMKTEMTGFLNSCWISREASVLAIRQNATQILSLEKEMFKQLNNLKNDLHVSWLS